MGLDGYYKTAQNQLDDGLFGQTLILSAFNYEKGRVYGLELTASYETNGFATYANAAYSVARGENWDSAQFLFDPADIDDRECCVGVRRRQGRTKCSRAVRDLDRE